MWERKTLRPTLRDDEGVYIIDSFVSVAEEIRLDQIKNPWRKDLLYLNEKFRSYRKRSCPRPTQNQLAKALCSMLDHCSLFHHYAGSQKPSIPSPRS